MTNSKRIIRPMTDAQTKANRALAKTFSFTNTPALYSDCMTNNSAPGRTARGPAVDWVKARLNFSTLEARQLNQQHTRRLVLLDFTPHELAPQHILDAQDAVWMALKLKVERVYQRAALQAVRGTL